MRMNVFEMEGFLRGKCVPRDLKVNETDAEYLVRKFAEAEAKCAALAAENAKLKDYLAPIGLKVEGTPATDTFLDEVRAQGVEMLAKNHQSIVNALKGDSLFSDGEYRHAAIVSAAVYFAAELRKGGNQ
ncbi:TPA: hypothetical protein LR157_003572 [Escherichia coli]|nr:hypothetical protein [Escherichia coli]HBL9052133.1 hypothetical protein [Escherichia coli]